HRAEYLSGRTLDVKWNPMRVTTISEDGGYIILRAPKGFGDTVEASTILMADIVSARLNG
ncbi:MAG: hypothetical protein ACR2N7_13315, partial [Acidimicrobiia bacterium]